MEVTIIDEIVKKYIINDNVSFEEFEDKGYFFVPDTGKIVIMNESAYFLWCTITEYANTNKSVRISELFDVFNGTFNLSIIDSNSFEDDMRTAIDHFENECFLIEVDD